MPLKISSLLVWDIFPVRAICHDDRRRLISFWPVDIASDQAFEAFELDSYILLEYVWILLVVNDVQILSDSVGHPGSDDE